MLGSVPHAGHQWPQGQAGPKNLAGSQEAVPGQGGGDLDGHGNMQDFWGPAW